MPASIGVNLRVTGNCRQGGRKYMEDFFSVAYQQTEDEKDLEYAFFGIYDGHGGAEAAAFAKEHLMETIIKHKNFWSDNDEDVLRAIKDGYIATHYAMWREQSKWPRTSSGLPSTAGTTASVAFIRRGKIYIGHVGDSGIVLGYQEPGSSVWKAQPLTKDHKPENPDEMKRIESCGGKVVSKSGVPRVVWNRPKIGHQGPVRRSTPIDEIPFLAVARSLGDFWSYNSQINQFVVSPDPDCSVLPIDTNIHRCLVFGTDGFFNMLSPAMAVHIVKQAERHNECAALSDSVNKVWLNPSKLLVERALDRWDATKMRADNTSVVTLMLDPPGPPRAQVLKDRKKNLPESGLKIMTRYDGTTPQDSPIQSSCSRSVQTADNISQTTSLENIAKPVVPVVPSETISSPTVPEKEKIEEHINKAAEKLCSEVTSDNVPISSSDVSSKYPLKERNFVPKLRESTSFDPREPCRLSDIGKENDTEKIDDKSIQINEISSSNIQETSTEDDGNVESTVKNDLEKDGKCVLRSSSKKVVKNGENEEKKAAKRKLDGEETTHLQRKSLRISLTQKFLEAHKKPAPCTLAEEKLKKIAEEAEKLKKLSDQPTEVKSKVCSEKSSNKAGSVVDRKLTITQKILKSKKVNLKKKSLLNTQLNKKKLRNVLDAVLAKTTQNKVLQRVKRANVEKKKSLKGPIMIRKKLIKLEEKNAKSNVKIVKLTQKKSAKVEEKLEKAKNVGRPKSDNKKVVSGKFSNFKRQSVRTSSARLKEKVLIQATNKSLKNNIANTKRSDVKAANMKSTKDTGKKVSPTDGRSQKPSDLRKSKSDMDSRVTRDTRNLLSNNGALRSAVREFSEGRRLRASSEGKKLNAKEVVREVTTKGIKNGLSKPKQDTVQSPKKCTLRQRIQDKTKTLRKTVLRKSS